MAWDINFDISDRILCVASHGTMQIGTLKQMCAEAIANGRERGANLYLMDHRDMTPALGTLDMHSYPQFLRDVGARKEAKVALVFSATVRSEDATFFENVLVNQGFTFRVFGDLPSARAWLIEKEGTHVN